MSYDLAVWEGERPADHEVAGDVYEALMEAFDHDWENEVPPTPRIRAYVEALLDRWPDIDMAQDSPWSMSPLMESASGPIVYLTMTYSRADEATRYAAGLAQQHELVCYNPQSEQLEPA